MDSSYSDYIKVLYLTRIMQARGLETSRGRGPKRGNSKNRPDRPSRLRRLRMRLALCAANAMVAMGRRLRARHANRPVAARVRRTAGKGEM